MADSDQKDILSDKVANSSVSEQEFKKSALVELFICSNLLPEEVERRELLNEKSYEISGLIIGWIQVKNMEIVTWTDDPLINIIAVFDDEKLIHSLVVPATYEADFNIEFMHPVPVFGYYSSTVGYMEYYYYDNKKGMFMKSMPFDELEQPDSTSINLENQTIQVLKKGTLKSFIPIKK